ncbi:hypothetical protein BaRGS_00019337, partial [Batillaria attramentaria]
TTTAIFCPCLLWAYVWTVWLTNAKLETQSEVGNDRAKRSNLSKLDTIPLPVDMEWLNVPSGASLARKSSLLNVLWTLQGRRTVRYLSMAFPESSPDLQRHDQTTDAKIANDVEPTGPQGNKAQPVHANCRRPCPNDNPICCDYFVSNNPRSSSRINNAISGRKYTFRRFPSPYFPCRVPYFTPATNRGLQR